MDYLKIVLSSVLSIAALFVIIKLIGNRSIAQMTAFDYINGITIGSITAEVAINIEGDIIKPLIAVLVYGIVIFIIDLITRKSIIMRKFFSGTPTILFDNQKLNRKGFKKVRIDIDEFLMMCRSAGYFDLSQIKTVMFEENGSISILPKSDYRPVQPIDMKVTTSEESYFINVIVDGKIMEKGLKKTGKDLKWLMGQLKINSISKVTDVFLACLDSSGKINIYKKTDN